MPSHNVSYPSTGQRRWWGIYTALYLVGVLWLLLGIFRPYYVYDGGIPVVGAVRILDGELPYRDFYANYSAGQFYLTAAVFGLTGPSLLAQRVLSVIVRSLIALIAFALMRRLAPRSVAIVAWGLILAWLSFFGAFGYTGFPALLCSLASMLFMSRALGQGCGNGRLATGGLCASGLAAGLTFLFRQDFGVYIGAAQVLFLAAYSLAPLPLAFDKPRLRGLLRSWSLFAAGVVTVVLGPVVYFSVLLGPGELFHTLFLWPYELTKNFRGLPYPRPWASLEHFETSGVGLAGLLLGIRNTLPFSLPIVVFGIQGWKLLKKWWLQRQPTSPRFWMKLGVLLYGALSFNQVFHRSDPLHLFPTFCAAVILLVALLGEWAAARSGHQRQVVLIGLALLLLMAPPSLLIGVASLPAFDDVGTAAADAPRARGVPIDPDQLAALAYIRHHTEPDEPIFVGNLRHDQVVWNDIVFYFLAERPIATRYHHFDPGMTTTYAIQQEIIDELERHDVRHVVVFAGGLPGNEPNHSTDPGSRLLDQHLQNRYRPVFRTGRYEVRQRHDSPS